MIRMSNQAPAFQAEDAALAQIGWLGQTGQTYGLDDKPGDTERGGFTPLYIQVGRYVTNEHGSKILED